MSDATFATNVQTTMTQYFRRMMSLGNMATGGRPRGYESLIQPYLVSLLLLSNVLALFSYVEENCLIIIIIINFRFVMVQPYWENKIPQPSTLFGIRVCSICVVWVTKMVVFWVLKI